MKLNITKVYSTDTKKDGSKLINKFGKPYFRTAVKAKEYGEEWINGFTSFSPDWEGKEVELEISETEFQGKKGKAFTLPKKEDLSNHKLEEILIKLSAMNLKVELIADYLGQKFGKIAVKEDGVEYPEEEINPDDIPF